MTDPTTDRLREASGEPDRCLICGETVPRDKGHWHAALAEGAPAPDLIAAVEAHPWRYQGRDGHAMGCCIHGSLSTSREAGLQGVTEEQNEWFKRGWRASTQSRREAGLDAPRCDFDCHMCHDEEGLPTIAEVNAARLSDESR